MAWLARGESTSTSRSENEIQGSFISRGHFLTLDREFVVRAVSLPSEMEKKKLLSWHDDLVLSKDSGPRLHLLLLDVERLGENRKSADKRAYM